MFNGSKPLYNPAEKYYTAFKNVGAFLVGANSNGCQLPTLQAKQGFLLRRVTGATMASGNSSTKLLTIQTVPAAYDEIYQDATIQYEPTSENCVSDSEQLMQKVQKNVSTSVCIGINQGLDCGGTAAGPIPLYENDIISLVCSDCFVSLQAGIFFDLQIKGFKLVSLKAGFRQVGIQQKIQVDMAAKKSWSAGVDKELHLAPPTTLISFKIVSGSQF